MFEARQAVRQVAAEQIAERREHEKQNPIVEVEEESPYNPLLSLLGLLVLCAGIAASIYSERTIYIGLIVVGFSMILRGASINYWE